MKGDSSSNEPPLETVRSRLSRGRAERGTICWRGNFSSMDFVLISRRDEQCGDHCLGNSEKIKLA